MSLTGGESVHLNDWQELGHIDELSLAAMARTRYFIEEGLGLRMKKGETEDSIKVRQPLSEMTYYGEKLSSDLEAIMCEEVNVKKVVNTHEHGEVVTLNKKITPELHREGLVREVIRAVQTARKTAGLEIDDRIVLALSAEGELALAIAEHTALIEEETLVSGKIEPRLADTMHDEVVQVEGQDLRVMLVKA